jgi:predicted Zn-dependent protease
VASRVEQFQGLVERQPENELFRFSLAQALLSDGRSEESIPHLEMCIARKADWMIPRILLGKIFAKSGRKADAQRLLSEALELAISQSHEDPERELRALLADLGRT